jgi:ribosomal protein S18 acetylase RimI-like enzyme
MKIKRIIIEELETGLRAIRKLKIDDEGRNVTGSERELLSRFLFDRRNVLIVAEEGIDPAGFLTGYILDRADGRPAMVRLYEIGVASQYRRRGVASAMIDMLKHICGAEGAYKMWVHTNRSNEAARRLYERTGGVPNPSGDEMSFLYTEDQFN